MYQGKKIIGIIPARAGSKGILNKNMALLNGQPLIYWTIKSAKESELLDEIVVSTDGADIKAFSQEQGVSVVERPPELALDTSKTIECIMHTLSVYEQKGQHFDYMMILQPTSPLRRAMHIDGMIQWQIDHNYNDGVSVSPISCHPTLIRYKRGDSLENVLNQTSTVRRQDMTQAYYVNGCLYLFKTDELTLQTSLNDARNGYEIDSYFTLDINTPEDLQSCEILLSANQTK